MNLRIEIWEKKSRKGFLRTERLFTAVKEWAQ